MRVLLTMQCDTQRDQSAGISPRIFSVIRHRGKPRSHDRDYVRGDLSRRSTSLAEAVKSQVLVRLAQ
jgi:hypothetical protein